MRHTGDRSPVQAERGHAMGKGSLPLAVPAQRGGAEGILNAGTGPSHDEGEEEKIVNGAARFPSRPPFQAAQGFRCGVSRG